MHFGDASGAGLAIRHRAQAPTLMHFHKMLTRQKYRMLFSPKRIRRPGPKGPAKELIEAVVEMKRRIALGAARELPNRSL
jgi:hypothetical protein